MPKSLFFFLTYVLPAESPETGETERGKDDYGHEREGLNGEKKKKGDCGKEAMEIT